MRTDRPTRGCRGGLERSTGTPAGSTLFTLALQVEERVVDTDREPDEQDDHADVRVERDQVARDREQTHRCEHRAEREQHRETCSDESTEGDDEDDQGYRQREHAGLHEVLRNRLVELLLGVDTELLDCDAWMAGGGGGECLDHGLVEHLCL